MKNKFTITILSLISLSSIMACQNTSSNVSSNLTSTSSEILSSEIVSSSSISSSIDYGTLTINDIEIAFMGEMLINPIFSNDKYEEELIYEFDGNNIQITEDKVKGLVPGTTTIVTAKGQHFTATFKVIVTYINAILTNNTGAESKYLVAVPEDDNYVVHFNVKILEYVNEYTRLSSFAFNGSNNSWYNIEMQGDGSINLFANFLGKEKKWIYLGNKSNFTNSDNVLEYKVDLLKNGLSTRFYFNEKLVCSYSEKDMLGSEKLSSLEVTSAADRENAGKYTIELKDVYYELENSENYQKMINSNAILFPNIELTKDDGSEDKYYYGDISAISDSFLYSTTIDVVTWDNNKTRPCAIAFNGSDNSWYNIEMNSDGNLILYGRFNGVEKYNIFLDNKSNLMVNNKIHFTVNILKRGQATWYFFNDRLVCWYTEKELENYENLSGFEVTAATDVWQDGGAYKVELTDTKVELSNSSKYKTYMDKVFKSYEDTTLKSDDGAEQRAPEIAVSDNCVYTTTVIIKSDANGWFRPCAFAFNNSDNSWYNIETDEGGSLTLFARFNGIEKYFISLGNKTDYLIDGFITLNISILKRGQSTAFFVNDILKADFNDENMTGYSGLYTLFVTSCADRSSSAFEVLLKNQRLDDEESEMFNKYKNLL